MAGRIVLISISGHVFEDQLLTGECSPFDLHEAVTARHLADDSVIAGPIAHSTLRYARFEV